MRAAEVVIAPPALYVIPVAEQVRKEIKVAAQNCYIKTSGAYTGEIRCVLQRMPTTASELTRRFT